MALVHDLDLPAVDVFSPDPPEPLPTAVQRLRAAGHWLVATPMGPAAIEYDAVRELQKDTRLRPLGTHLFEMQGVTGGPASERFRRSILNLEGEPHTRLRRLVSRAFTPRAADRHRPMMRAWVDERAQGLAARGGGDVVAELTEAYPIAVICQLVGAREADWARFSAWASDVFRVFNLNLAEDLPVIEAAQDAMRDYIVGLIEERRHGEPREDLLSELLRMEEAGDRLTYDELCDLVNTVILAGTDTTRNQLGLALMVLARHPGQWDELAGDPGRVPRAVEELLRIEPTAATTARVVVEEVTYRDVTFPAGSTVALMTAAANLDPEQVRCPLDLDLGADRGSFAALTFGSGPHYCLGAALARAELQEALAVLVRRWRRIEVVGEPEMKPYLGLYGPVRLPLRIEAR